MNSQAGSDAAALPLCVDLDGTLIRSDVLIESALVLLKRNPLYLFLLPLWLLKGKAWLKQEIARRVSLDPATLPYDRRLRDWLRVQQASHPVVLCTAADARLANAIAAHLGGFSSVIASDGRRNISGACKADALVGLYGEKGFDYAGNDRRDLKVWRHAHGAIVVNAPPSLAVRVKHVCDVLLVLPREPAGLKAWIKALRLHQWLKNALLFLPLLAAHKAFDLQADARAVAAFLLFGMCASGVYVLNDLLDLQADRQHSRKRNRPFAAGRLPPSAGLVVAPVLTVGAFVGALALAPRFALVLLGYYVLTLAYSLWLKRIVMLDVVLLAALYTVRVVAGAAAIRVDISFWLLAFSMFLFLSLAMLKRYAELRALQDSGVQVAYGRGYAISDLALVQSLGGASGYVSVLVLALYINSTMSGLLYDRPGWLWLLCPLLLYWISRVWIIANRGAMHDDPIVFAASDKASWAVAVLAAIFALMAAW